MLLTAHVQPSARQNSLTWVDEDTVKVRLTAPAKEGKANFALVELLSKELGVPKSRIQIVRGLTARLKHVLVT